MSDLYWRPWVDKKSEEAAEQQLVEHDVNKQQQKDENELKIESSVSQQSSPPEQATEENENSEKEFVPNQNTINTPQSLTVHTSDAIDLTLQQTEFSTTPSTSLTSATSPAASASSASSALSASSTSLVTSTSTTSSALAVPSPFATEKHPPTSSQDFTTVGGYPNYFFSQPRTDITMEEQNWLNINQSAQSAAYAHLKQRATDAWIYDLNQIEDTKKREN